MSLQVTMIEDEGPDRSEVSVAEPPTPPCPDVRAERHAAAVRSLRRLTEASQDLRAVLRSNEEYYAATLGRLEAGADVAASTSDIDIAGARGRVVDALAEFERARHLSRGTFVSAQFDGGMNMKQIGRAWGISRQLAHRFFKEARRDG